MTAAPRRAPSATASLAGRRVGFIGAGRIGSPMVQMLVGRGAEVTVQARREAVRDALAGPGCRAVADIADLGRDNEVVISCLFSDAQFSSIEDEIADVLAPGSVFASHTTGSPATLRRFAEALAAQGRDAQVVDAPFSGTQEHILAASLTVMLGGAPGAVDIVEPVVRSYADPVIRTGELGSALLLKLLNNVLFAANVQLGLEVTDVAQQAGIPLASVYEVFAASSGGTRAIEYMREFESPQHYADETRSFIRKDVAACEQVAAEVGLDLGLLGRVARDGRLDVDS
ncbi:NAD(P)-dependent oxidoreductase [uncultured Jatrophihabitans sp.]|uniref:NAD(P)-dependent oxidoreductase n=1 Tax=uncultured Jatrophihabitans sp. TaxID=1610747 RepID=UPI0035C95C15